MKRLLYVLLMMMSVSQMAIGQIDIHSHAITDGYMAAVKAHGMEMDEGFPIPAWSVEAHLAFMDEAGIQTSVLTMPAPQPKGVDAPAVCRAWNELCARLKVKHPGRFLFCAALPLPDVDAALKEAKYALDVLGADGVKLASNAYGQYLGDEALEPLMAYLNERKAVIITHPHKPSAANDALIASVPLASYEYLAESTRAILNMVAHDVLVRYPDLTVVVPHCGSFLPNALPRFKGLLPVMVQQGYMKQVDVDANISRLYFDLAGAATDDVIESLLTITMPDHILYGSDYPYVAPQALIGAKKSLESRLASHGLAPDDILSNNAARLLGNKH
ncbi:MAG: amidohydrolase [Bacteroidales bacterium]|nr:amidohydrolase [Bacteroidales bacterium]